MPFGVEVDPFVEASIRGFLVLEVASWGVGHLPAWEVFPSFLDRLEACPYEEDLEGMVLGLEVGH